MQNDVFIRECVVSQRTRTDGVWNRDDGQLLGGRADACNVDGNVDVDQQRSVRSQCCQGEERQRCSDDSSRYG